MSRLSSLKGREETTKVNGILLQTPRGAGREGRDVCENSPALCGSRGGRSAGDAGGISEAGGISAAGDRSGRTCLAPGSAQQGSPHTDSSHCRRRSERRKLCRKIREMHGGEGTNPKTVHMWPWAEAGDCVFCRVASTPLPLLPGLPCAQHTGSIPLGRPSGRRSRTDGVDTR